VRRLVPIDECARCDDDSRVSRPEVRGGGGALKRCAVCGQPASFQLNGSWYCVRHYLEVVKRGGGQGG
jgi:transcription elongation factor Elf1